MLDKLKIILLLPISFISIGCLQQPAMELTPVNQELFTVEEREYDFGTLKQSGGLVSHDFIFSYHGQEELKIKGVPTSCACTSASISRQLIKPGESATVTVIFDPNLHVEPDGKFFKTISVLTEPEIKQAPEFKIWAEIDLDLGPEFYKLKEEHNN